MEDDQEQLNQIVHEHYEIDCTRPDSFSKYVERRTVENVMEDSYLTLFHECYCCSSLTRRQRWS